MEWARTNQHRGFITFLATIRPAGLSLTDEPPREEVWAMIHRQSRAWPAPEHAAADRRRDGRCPPTRFCWSSLVGLAILDVSVFAAPRIAPAVGALKELRAFNGQAVDHQFACAARSSRGRTQPVPEGAPAAGLMVLYLMLYIGITAPRLSPAAPPADPVRPRPFSSSPTWLRLITSAGAGARRLTASCPPRRIFAEAAARQPRLLRGGGGR